MRKELIDFADWMKANYRPHKMYNSKQLVDLYLKSINSKASDETRSVTDNEQTKKTCHFVSLTVGHYAPCYPKFKCHEKCSFWY
jgi:hypothetical protein